MLTVFSLFMGVITLPIHGAGNLVQTGHDVIDKTINADNALYNYEYFKQTYEDIKALENKVKISERQIEDMKGTYGNTSNWGFETNQEYARLQAVKQGQMSQLEDVVATYNARSKMANRNIFKDGLIPSVLEIGSNILK